jgi:hypothetical protein
MSRKVAGAALADGAYLKREPQTSLSILEEDCDSIVGSVFHFHARARGHLGKTETRASGPLCGPREDGRILGKPEDVG